MLLLVSSIKLLAEIALFAFAGQWLLGLLAGAKRESNFFYRLFMVVTQPVVRGMRLISPRQVIDRHLPVAAFVLLVTVWFVATIVRIDICLKVGIDACR
ncbi:MAG: hypothetical protein WA210_15800 [Burkholderiaceae bacterium]